MITDKTKAIIPVHLYGHPADMVSISEIAEKNRLFVIEDAAEAHGATVLKKSVGGLGTYGVFSFYGNKNITSGEGGMITTNDPDLYERCIVLRDHAMNKEKRYWHDEIGFNYRMTNLQAALGCAQLERVEELLTSKKDIFNVYAKYLSGNTKIKLNKTYEWAENSYWQICVEIEGYDLEKRDELMLQLREKGVDSRPYFYPVSEMPMYESADTQQTHAIYQKGICLPTYFDLNEDQVKTICVALLDEIGN